MHWGQLVGEVAFQVVIEKLAGVVVVKSQQRVGLRKEIEETLTELGSPCSMTGTRSERAGSLKWRHLIFIIAIPRVASVAVRHQPEVAL